MYISYFMQLIILTYYICFMSGSDIKFILRKILYLFNFTHVYLSKTENIFETNSYKHYHYCYYYYYCCYYCGGGYKNSTIMFPAVCKRRQKGWSDGFGKPLLCILYYKNTRHRGGGESNVSMNPSMPCLGYLYHYVLLSIIVIIIIILVVLVLVFGLLL